MSFQLSKRQIKAFCGSYAYDRGETDYRAGKVKMTVSDPERSVYSATVQGSEARSRYRVDVGTGDDGRVRADCECLDPKLSAYYCRHIAAVLLTIHDIRSGSPAAEASRLPERFPSGGAASERFAASDPSSSEETALAGGMIGLFAGSPKRPSRASSLFDNRQPLKAEFALIPQAYGYRKSWFGIELKIGSKRTYAVPRIREFLARAERGESFVCSRYFTYDPTLHCFEESNDAVIRLLTEIYRNEKLYRDASGVQSALAAQPGDERSLPIPPSAWDELASLLARADDVKIEHDGRLYEGFRLSEDPLPLSFDFDQEGEAGENGGEPNAPARYRLDVYGLDRLTVMEDYGVVLREGDLIKLKPDPAERLAGLKRLLDSSRGSRGSRGNRVLIGAAQMEPFMERVIPGLMKLGSVRISEAVSARIVHAPLKAKLYLDRVKDRLLAGLEFQYGEVTINPLEERDLRRGADRILVRDGDKEARILELMERGRFAKTESGYFLEEEEEQYDFLYHVIPLLEPLLKVYATTAVKARLHVGHAPPKIRIEFDERTDWLSCRFELDGFPQQEIRGLIQAISDKRRYYKLAKGALMPLETPDYEALNRFIVTMKVNKGEFDGSELRLPLSRALPLLEEEHRHPAVKLGKSLRELLENVRNPDNLDFPPPESLAPILRDYQTYGYQWLKTLAHYRFGGILADDMGLGKTLQSIAFLVSALPEIRQERAPALIVCPASLMYNWLGELERFAPDIRAVVADGDKTERAHALRRASDTDVVIVSYPLLRRDLDLYAPTRYYALILDEAQAIKNYATQTAQAVKAVRAKHRFALTGTPVENSLEELWSSFDAVFPELFGDRGSFNEMTREAVARRARPFLLRRLKTDVLAELPEKIESNQTSELLPEQKKLYLAYLAKLRKESLKHLDEQGFGRSRIRILAGLTRLRQICCHPGLFVEGYDGGSAKFEQLMELVEECRGAGRRALVFSQFTEMLGMIAKEMGLQGIPYFYLDGQTPSAERVELCERFNDGERDVFLISLKAGGTGLNLAGADTVILYDLWWNPAVERQAMDRAHRMGQKNVVQVIRLVARDTVEEKMHAIQLRKQRLIEEVVQPGEEALASLTEEDIRELLRI